jgi:DNA-binding transcriptional LysR family regulator
VINVREPQKPVPQLRLKTRQLALLIHLDEERCVARAAEASGMTQPAASKLLREIEAGLDVKLFERHARGVAPTWYGEILVRRARLALSEIRLAHEEIAALKAGLSGTAAIGTVMNPGTNLVPMAVASVKQQHPAILISVEIDFSKPLVERLLQGHLDMLVARVLDSHGADALSFEPLANERHAVIAGRHHPLAGKRNLRLEDLVEQPWILPAPGSLVRDELVSVFLERGLPLPNNVVQTSSLPVINCLLRTTNMIAPLPDESVKPYLESGVLTVLIEDLGLDIGSFGIIVRRDHKLSPGAQVMLNALRKTAAKFYSGELQAWDPIVSQTPARAESAQASTPQRGSGVA